MANFTRFEAYIADLHHGLHNWDLPANGGHTFRLFACAEGSGPDPAAHSRLADLTLVDLSAVEGGTALTITVSEQNSGTFRLVIATRGLKPAGSDLTFRYLGIYNDTATGDPLFGFWDFLEDVTIDDGEELPLSFNQVYGMFQAGNCVIS